MTVVLPKILATGDETFLEVVPVAAILGTPLPAAGPAPPTPPASSPIKASSSPMDERQPYASLSQTEVHDFLKDPRTMMGTRFTCAPPIADAEGDEDLKGEWRLVAHTLRLGDDEDLEEEYAIRHEAYPDGPMPMSKDEVEHLLMYSRVSS